jgi:sulfate adenylyltransferase subunit 1
LLEHLESVSVGGQIQDAPFRFPVQRVIRPDQHFRGFAGQIAAGTVKPGDAIVTLPSGRTSRVKSIHTFDGELQTAFAPQSVTLTLEDEVDISRGDLIAHRQNAPSSAASVEASLVWLHTDPFSAEKTYLLKHTSQTVKAHLRVLHRLDIETLNTHAAHSLNLNEMGEVSIKTSRPLMVDSYRDNRITGSFILIDPANNATVGAGMVRRIAADRDIATSTSPKPGVILLLPQANLIQALEAELVSAGEDVITTRIQNPEVWRTLLHPGLIALIHAPNKAQAEIVMLTADGGDFSTQPLSPDADAEAISQELKRLRGTRVTKGEDRDDREF